MQSAWVKVRTPQGVFTAFKSISVRGSVKEAARSFRLVAAVPGGARAVRGLFADQAPVSILAGDEPIFTGYVDDRVPEKNPRSRTVTVSGRSKAADAIDCSCDHTKGDYVGKTLLDIAQDQDAFGIGFTCDFPLEPIDRFRFNPGESLFRGLEILARDHGGTWAGQADGGMKLTKAGLNPKRQPGWLDASVIAIGSASHNSANRHSELRVHGQSYKGTDRPNTQINAVARDTGVQRHRPLHVLHRPHATTKRVQDHAEHRRNREAGEGLTAIVTTPGWHDQTGALWTPGNKVWVDDEDLDLSQDMLMETIDYLQDGEPNGQGSRCVISLVDPRAHGGKGGGVNKSGASWGFDNSAAQG